MTMNIYYLNELNCNRGKLMAVILKMKTLYLEHIKHNLLNCQKVPQNFIIEFSSDEFNTCHIYIAETYDKFNYKEAFNKGEFEALHYMPEFKFMVDISEKHNVMFVSCIHPITLVEDVLAKLNIKRLFVTPEGGLYSFIENINYPWKVFSVDDE